ncbi:cyclic nucleotide-binding domain-containing protein [Emticicia sp. CRIBPO]|uniref:Crp/Fnr family transcriptional regulator n=1 Tax=Emticicia sp. CRIBPO TaxID=2683258 RepID=UPI001412F41B|nr:Crp/Fnr family transcriptional regulator [Emticicia sp. CRIBPO]NBA89162.1 cyclic nucleotide-binding domain-containing protein [Emticicia sp. CRIBPO]
MSQILRHQIEKIISLTDAEFEYVLSHFRFRKFKKHQFVVQEGLLVENDFFILSGCLKSYSTDANGKEHIIQFGLQDWWITDYQAYYDQGVATVNIDCVEETELLCLSYQNREKLCAEMHKIEHFFRKKTNKRNVALQQRILSLLSSSAKERYDKLLEQYPQLFQKVPKQLIASYLGVTRETLSRFNASSK